MSSMRVILVLVSVVLATASWAVQQTIVFVDGTRMAIQSYEVKGGIVQFTTAEGRLQSVPSSYVNLVATEEANGGGGSGEATAEPPPPPRRRPAPRREPEPRPAPPDPMPAESVEPEPPISPPISQPAPAPPAPIAAPSNMDMIPSPPPPWTSTELQVSLQVPSSEWSIEDMPPSFDVAVALNKESTEARATLALIRQELRGRGDFRDVVSGIESSISAAPGYQPMSGGEMNLEPYQAHEFRFTKNVGFVTVYNRLIVVYSRDLAYVLSLTCPEGRVAENERDFEALARGLVITKSRRELTF